MSMVHRLLRCSDGQEMKEALEVMRWYKDGMSCKSGIESGGCRQDSIARGSTPVPLGSSCHGCT
jgi:hypothetical protein